MSKLLLLSIFISLGFYQDDRTNQEQTQKYFRNDSFSKVYLELDFENQTFTYNYYSCLSDAAEGTFKIKGDKLILKTKHYRRHSLGKFHFINNRKKLVQQYRFNKHQYVYNLIKD